MTRNIVLICLDTVRYDYFTSFAPRLEGRDGMSFLRCYAASPWSMPSHASIFTETLPHIHDIHPGKTFTFAKLEQDDTFLGRLDGYKIMGISANGYASSGFAFDELFDQFHDYSPSVPFQAGLKPQVLQRQTGKSGRERYLNFLTRCLAANHPIKSLANGVWGVMPKTDYIAKCTPLSYANHRGAEEIGELALEYANTTTEPFFIFLNLMDAHGTYEPLPQYDESLYNVPDGWHSDDLDPDIRMSPSPNGDAQPHVENYREIYRAAIEYVDSVINSLINDLLAQTNRETTVILFSDHGENLGYESDEYLVGHNSLSNSVLHTPLKIINPPASYPSEVEEPISQLQLGSLINSIAGNESFPNDICRDIIPAEAPRAGGCPGGDLKPSGEPDAPHLDRMARCLLWGDRRIEWDSIDRCREFKIERDHPEQEHQVSECGGSPEAMSSFFANSIAEYQATLTIPTANAMDNIDAPTRDRLEDLGYL